MIGDWSTTAVRRPSSHPYPYPYSGPEIHTHTHVGTSRLAYPGCKDIANNRDEPRDPELLLEGLFFSSPYCDPTSPKGAYRFKFRDYNTAELIYLTSRIIYTTDGQNEFVFLRFFRQIRCRRQNYGIHSSVDWYSQNTTWRMTVT